MSYEYLIDIPKPYTTIDYSSSSPKILTKIIFTISMKKQRYVVSRLIKLKFLYTTSYRKI